MSNLQYVLHQANMAAAYQSGNTSSGRFTGGFFGLLTMIAWWFVFKKAGKPGWAAIIPFYNFIVLMQIIKRPWWWILLLFIPIVDIVILAFIAMDVARAFGKGSGFAVLLFFLPFIGYPILAWGDAKYQPAALGRLI